MSTSEEIDQRTRELFATAAEIKDLFFNYSPLPQLSHGQFLMLRHIYLFENDQCPFGAAPPGLSDGEGGIKITALAKLMRNAPPTVSQKADDLERLGYIERRRGRRDRRAVYVSLTPRGQTLMARAMQLYDHLGRRVVARLGDEQIRVFVQTLQNLKDALAAEQAEFAAALARGGTEGEDAPPEP